VSLELEYVGFAEGGAMDYRGSVALVGFAPQFIPVPDFPAQISPFFVVVAEDSRETKMVSGSTIIVGMDVEDPDGATIFHTEQVQDAQKKHLANLPSRFQLVAQIPILASKPGNYKYKLKVTTVGENEPIIDVEKSLRVILMADLEASPLLG